ncbi:iron chaperone [Brachybacterium hainanense]|uniref:Iron chaperone n=1 Tax=Brachybacterium hainanense TaxID=1541174 RepID=A0ABV6R8D0_9MICO
MVEKPKTVQEYVAAVDPERRAELERIRDLVARLVPEVEETMSYGMPTLMYRGRALVYLTASKKHMSFYPSSFAIEELRDRLGGYRTTEHAIQFTLANPLPDDLIADLVAVHRRHIEAGSG